MDVRTRERLREVHAASYGLLVGQLYPLCGGLAEAEDVVQEAFVRAAQRHREFAKVANPEAWLRTVAVNLSRSRWRHESVRRRFLDRQVVSAHVDRTVDLDDDHVDLVAALRSLPRDQREAIVLHHLVDLPVDEVAATVGAGVNTVKSRLRRGRQALAVRLDTPEAEEAHHA